MFAPWLQVPRPGVVARLHRIRPVGRSVGDWLHHGGAERWPAALSGGVRNRPAVHHSGVYACGWLEMLLLSLLAVLKCSLLIPPLFRVLLPMLLPSIMVYRASMWVGMFGYISQRLLGPLTVEQDNLFLQNSRFVGLKFPDMSRPETLQKKCVLREYYLTSCSPRMITERRSLCVDRHVPQPMLLSYLFINECNVIRDFISCFYGMLRTLLCASSLSFSRLGTGMWGSSHGGPWRS